LLFSAKGDQVVSNAAQKNICNEMVNCRIVEIPEARHEILQEKDRIQKYFWDAFEQFLFPDFGKK
jgi:lysophospholipase